MADASKVFQTLTPAGNGTNTVFQLPCILGPSIVRRILITWPPGCGGLVGCRVEAGGGYAFPDNPINYMFFDDYTYAFDVDNQIDSGQWNLKQINRDFIVHSIQIVFEFDYLRGQVQPNANAQPIAL